MLRIFRLAMLRLTSLGNAGRKRWCTAIVLVAICALTVSVATRYGSAAGFSETAKTLQNQSSQPGLQRLLDNATTWTPPVIDIALLQEPGHYPEVARSSPTVSSVLLERNLYNRPPPAVIPFSS
jgi:hypothetical protein